MAIVKRGSRRILIENTEYRWTVRSKPTYSQGNDWSPLSFAVERVNQSNTTLVVEVEGASRPDNWIGAKSEVVTPSLVERAIRQALHQDWRPDETGGSYILVLPVN